jgi:hypothetical protein
VRPARGWGSARRRTVSLILASSSRAAISDSTVVSRRLSASFGGAAAAATRAAWNDARMTPRSTCASAPSASFYQPLRLASALLLQSDTHGAPSHRALGEACEQLRCEPRGILELSFRQELVDRGFEGPAHVLTRLREPARHLLHPGMHLIVRSGLVAKARGPHRARRLPAPPPRARPGPRPPACHRGEQGALARVAEPPERAAASASANCTSGDACASRERRSPSSSAS